MAAIRPRRRPPSRLRTAGRAATLGSVPAMVATDPAAALAAAAGGSDVVLVARADDAVAAREAAAGLGGNAGRLAVLVGDPADEADLAAARDMAAEVFGRPPPGRGGR